MRRFLVALLALVLPSQILAPLMCVLGHRMSRRASIGFSLVFADVVAMERAARIGHFNIIRCRRLVLRDSAYIGVMNYINGPVSIWLNCRAGIGNRNVVTRAPKPVSYGPAHLRLGELAKITASHSLDCMRDISLGDFSILAGKGSQLWTHGYVHAESGPARYRIDGSICIDHNVYIGSACVISAGVKIATGVIVGAHCAVSKDLEQPGLYVSQSLRHIGIDSEEKSRDLVPVANESVCEKVFIKRRTYDKTR